MTKEAPAHIVAAYARQAAACGQYGSPFTERVLSLLPDALGGDAFSAGIREFAGDPGTGALALRSAGALHALARDGRCAALSAAYPPGKGDLRAGIVAALRDHGDWLAHWLRGPPQTNEVGRSAAILGGALVALAGRDMPLEVMELGASAGLNLFFDRHGMDLGAAGRVAGDGARLVSDWRGNWPALRPVEVASRAGVDVAPIDPGSAVARTRLFAYVWPDQPERHARLADALDLAAKAPERVATGDAAPWLEARLAEPPTPGRMRFVFHTIALQYMPEDTRTRITAALARAGAEATEDTPLAHLAMESDGRVESAALTLTLWPGGAPRLIARPCYHGRFVDWL